LDLKKRVNSIYVKHTGQKPALIQKSMERDNFMTAEVARNFGLVDKIITHRNELEIKFSNL
jgi:ATP-dependent Clp protease protease subunit